MDNIASVLKKAADDALAAQVYNTNREPSIRPSRAGLPLLQLVLEDFVLPKLPKPPEKQWQTKADPYALTMRLTIGHLFEKTVEELLLAQYANTSTEVRTQEVVNLGDMQGSCDLLVIDHKHQWATVVECKALKAYSVQEVVEQKLNCDNWGYLTQLALYVLALKRRYPTYEVTGCWYVWIKQLEKHTKQALRMNTEQLEAHYLEIQEKTAHYLEFKRDFSEGKLSYAVGKLMHRTEDLPRKINGGGYMKGSCGLHFNSYTDLFTKADGTLVDNAEDTLLLLTRAAYYGEGECQTKVTELLTSHKK